MKIKLLFGFLLSCLMSAVYGQHTVSGKVIDQKGESMIETTVIEKGTTNGTTTDLNGNYTLEVSSPDVSLHFSFVGYEEKTVPVEGRAEINVTLKEKNEVLDEVIKIGYGTEKKQDISGSIEVVESKEIESVPIMSSEEVLQGKASGVFVAASSGAPGAPISVRIRGVGTPNNTDPLYVVDGMPIKDATFGKNDNPQGVNFLNPNDIESIQVLKDASATAIYGTRGANGVVIITTKKGKKGEPTISFNGYYGRQNLPENQKLDVLNAPQFARLNNEATGRNTFDSASIPYLSTTDWQDKVLRVAPMHNAQLSLSGGSESGNYYMSFNKFAQEGIVNLSSYDRYSYRINSQYQAAEWLNIGENITLTSTKNQRQQEQSVGGPIGSALRADPTIPVHDDDPSTDWAPMENTPTVGNPVGIMERRHYIYNSNRLQGSAFAEIEPINNLKYKFNAGLDRSWGNKEELWPKYHESAEKNANQPNLRRQREDWNNYLIEHTLNYKFSINEIHNINLLAGYTVQEEKRTWISASAHVPTNEDLYFDAVEGKDEIQGLGGAAIEWGLMSYLARVGYSYRSKYILNATIRRDGSSRFGENFRWGNFPAFSAAWKLSEEAFMEPYTTINLLKLRVGWGIVGNQNIPPYVYTTSVTTKPDPGVSTPTVHFGEHPVNNEIGLWLAGMANQDIQWETTRTTNIGIDLHLWESELTATLDLYNKNTTDLLLEQPVPVYSGIDFRSIGKYIANAGEVNNKGIDLNLNYRKVTESGFGYNVGGNMSRVWNKVISLDNGAPLTSSDDPDDFPVKMIEGKPIGAFYGYVHEGIFESEEEINNHARQQPGTAVGDFKFKDLNQDGIIDDSDQTIIGYALPDFTYGFSAGASYKNIKLDIFTQGVIGNQIINKVKQDALYNFKVNTNVSTDLLNHYGRKLEDGSVITDTDVPRLDIRDVNNNNRNSSYFIEDGSYFRIKTITLSYNIPSNWIESININSARVYVTVQNLYTFTKYSGYNPEIGVSSAWDANPLAFGVDNAVYPLPRTLLFGIDLKM